MPTSGGWLALVGSAACFAVGRTFGVAELFVLGAIVVVLVAAAVVWVRAGSVPTDARRRVRPAEVAVGTAASVEIELANAGLRPTGAATATDGVSGTGGAALAVPGLAAGARTTSSYRLPTSRRGRIALGPLAIVQEDPFGLARRRTEVLGGAEVTVLPLVERLGALHEGWGPDDPVDEGHRPTSAASSSDDLAHLRPYVLGDDLRRVHWRSTARTGELIVRQDEEHRQGHLTVWLDARADSMDGAAFERAVSATATLVAAAAATGDRVRLLDSHGTDTGTVDARAAHRTLLEHLAVIVQHRAEAWAPPPPLDHRDGHVVAVTALTPTTLAQLVDVLGGAPRTRIVDLGDAPETGSAIPRGWQVVPVGASASFAAAWDRATPARAR